MNRRSAPLFVSPLSQGLVLALGAGLLSACFVPRESGPRRDEQCTRCHGDPAREGDAVARAAPPTDTFGNTASSYPGVGAHEEHLIASKTHAPVACRECHKVPETPESEGHNDNRTQLVFGTRATKDGGLSPAWDLGTRQCTNSGCHGPVSGKWTRPRTSDEACGSCHTLPPPRPHPQFHACHACHADVVNAQGAFHAPERHVDGVVQKNEAACDTCHGANDAGAPPRSLDGGTDVTHVGVGAHQAHLSGGNWSKPVSCDTCHVVPATTVTATHPNGGAAEVSADAGYDSATRTCAASCHYGRSPAWNIADAGISCSSCHGAPPPTPHPQATSCGLCHPFVNNQVARATHVNGMKDAMLPAACNACHGSSTNPAPPRDLSGSMDTTRAGVGAHQTHLRDGGTARPVSCDECHVVPAMTVEPGHLNGTTDIRFQGVARSNLANPTYSAANATCSNAACHDVSNLLGAPGGGMHTTPRWTLVDGSQRQCNSCHGLPPPAPHPAQTDCATCHQNAAPDGGFVRPDLHINGRVDFLVR